MDLLLQKMFEPQRWLEHISKGYDKDIRKDQLYQLTKPEVRASFYAAIRDGRYRISPPHTAQIPKDTPGEFRTVYVNEPADRIILSIINDLLFETCPDMVHPACKSYLKGTGCGKVIQEISHRITRPGLERDTTVGWKSDFSKYFDSVPLPFIDRTFDQIEQRTGKSAVTDLLRNYYHNDLYFDEKGSLQTKYQSLKQGCAPAAFLADAVLYRLDERLSALKGMYVRYSDDTLYIGEDYAEAMETMKDELALTGLTLNPKKVEYLRNDRWFKFLGFSLRGSDISLSSSRIKSFQKEIETRTVKSLNTSPGRALASVNRFLYRGDGTHSWATQVLPVINVKTDINTLNAFVMDCLRATATGRKRLGGLGYLRDGKTGCVARGRGRNVSANRGKTPGRIEGYHSLGCMRGALLTNHAAYEALVRTSPA